MPAFEFTIWDGRAKNPESPFKRFSQNAPTLDQAVTAVSIHFAKISKRRIEERMADKEYVMPPDNEYSIVEDFKIMPTAAVINILLTDLHIIEERRKRIIKP